MAGVSCSVESVAGVSCSVESVAGVSTESCVNGVPKKSFKEKTTPFEKWLTLVIHLAVSVII